MGKTGTEGRVGTASFPPAASEATAAPATDAEATTAAPAVVEDGEGAGLVTGTLDEAVWTGEGRFAEPSAGADAGSAGFAALGLAGSDELGATGVGVVAGFAEATAGATGCRGVGGGVWGPLAAGCDGAWVGGVAGFAEAVAGVAACRGVDGGV